jgi:uncharacterized protein YutE (UPF0331/DUF86 family)
MYFVDRSKIEETLVYMEQVLNEVKETHVHSFRDQLSMERMVHVLIESVLDVGNMMIDGFIMRDPGSYEDIIDILVDEKVISAEEEADYKALIQVRKMIVTDYVHVDHNKLIETMNQVKGTLSDFSSSIRTYLDNELGVANAFSNEE